MARVSNERKNLSRLTGEFLVASRLTQRGYMVSLQWGTTIGYDILIFDKEGHVAFLEVKSGAQESRRWILQKKYAFPTQDKISTQRRFVCCVDLAVIGKEPDVYVFPCEVVAEGIRYFFSGKYPNSPSFHLSLDFKPQGRTKENDVLTVGQHINADSYKEKFDGFGVKPITE
jgi:Holliday junction resolvase-like predicted endonuclease